MVALVILVFLDVQDAGTQLPEALSRAVEQALAPNVKVEIRPITAGIDERALIDAGTAAGATAVARLTWADGQRLKGSLAVHLLAGDRRATQTLTFEATDPLSERGRALGLGLAALVAPERGVANDVRGSPAPAPPAPPAAVMREPAVAEVVTRSDGRSAPPPARAAWFLDAAAEGGLAVGGAGSGLGGTIGLGRGSTGRLGWRVGARARFGEVAVAQASVLSVGLSAGLIVTVRRAAAGERLEVDLRLDGLALYEALTHFSSDDAEPVRKGRFLPGASLGGEVRYRLGPGAALVVGGGPEATLGRTDVVVHEVKVAELVPLRVSVHGGLRMTF